MTAEFQEVASKLTRLTQADCAVVLIGSAARGCRAEDSDIDLLFVTTEKVTNLPVISGYHIKDITESDFLKRLNAGEDFEAWCIRYGETLIDRGVWGRVSVSGNGLWPRWETKVVHGARRLFLAAQLSKMGDRSAAREELIFVLGHIARGLLLKAGTFPLSGPELATQVKDLGYSHLADLHERLRCTNSPSDSDLSLSIRYSKKLLVHLDRAMYGKLAQDHSRVMRSKSSKRAEFVAARNGRDLKPPK
jgi:predicted nucleotidyltransferase